MPAVIVQHRVADFDTWLKHYEAHAPARVAHGVTGTAVWQAADDPNNVYVVIEASDLGKLQEFGASTDLQQTMAAAGVLGPPVITPLVAGRKYPH